MVVTKQLTLILTLRSYLDVMLMDWQLFGLWVPVHVMSGCAVIGLLKSINCLYSNHFLSKTVPTVNHHLTEEVFLIFSLNLSLSSCCFPKAVTTVRDLKELAVVDVFCG